MTAVAAELEVAWEATGFDGPESAVFDSDKGVIYLSNVNGEANEADGNGYVARLSPSGEIIDKEWVTGLNAPKGLALHEGMLYVSDINRLVAIDTASGEVAATYEAPDAKFLNDVTADDDGRVFVSDMVANTIYVLENEAFDVWLHDEALENPNGLLAESDRLLVGSWGVMADDFSTEVPGHLRAIDYDTKAITDIGGGEPIGNLDGVEADGKGGYLVTDWISGGLHHVAADGAAELVMDLNPGSADHEVMEAEGLAVVPMMMNGKVTAYRME
jgi:streptogramin lyase